MTEKQRRRFYFPAWNQCAEANDWVMERGRLLASLKAQRAEAMAALERPPGRRSPAFEERLRVLDYAEQLAAQEHRGVKPEDLRHGCNLVATGGQVKSSEDLDNPQVDRVVQLFRLLRDPEDLDAIMAWIHPEEMKRKSLAGYIRTLAPEATLSAISNNAFGTVFWEDLDQQRLRWLLRQVKGRQQRYGQRTRTGDPF